MTKLLMLCLSASLLAAACATKKKNETTEADCPPKACTMEFRTVGVIFKDNTGDTLLVKNFSVKIKGSNKELPSAASESPQPENPYYLVANDGDKSALNIEGDTLLISATHPTTNKLKTTEMVVSGGRCECHINKMSGEQTIVFD
ncbi:hypothetical protein [Olivibacter domesticus]|uniref:NlpE N-terminal domain-containing protein n=1 Tax=Olivibacter domesticus TaxID=407022 RepID=A0A1H7INS2_OLID1|nr:hypothetical protein [Olivibacter domesticus]SEK63377.1 hypothetical protein SAMN05661044_00751 [Olivibacter domesticus]